MSARYDRCMTYLDEAIARTLSEVDECCGYTPDSDEDPDDEDPE